MLCRSNYNPTPPLVIRASLQREENRCVPEELSSEHVLFSPLYPPPRICPSSLTFLPYQGMSSLNLPERQ